VKAVIMAGGEGSRLRPLTSNTPKPMLPVANVPMMEHVIRLCRKHGAKDVIATVQFLANVVRNYFGDGDDLGVRMHYTVEESPMGTAGSVGLARDMLDDTFLVISGDALTDIDLGEVVKAHKSSGALATIVLYEAENPLEFGIVITKEDGTIERFLEKPTWGQVFSDTVNTGIYVLEPGIFDFIPSDRPSDFSQDVFPTLLAQGLPIHGHVAKGYWEDVGNIEAYSKAHRDVLDGQVEVEIPGFQVSDHIWQGADVLIGPDVAIEGPVVIGNNCRIESGARLREYTVLGDNVVVGADSQIQRTIVHENASIGARVSLRGTVVGKGADLREGARSEVDVVVGDGSLIGSHAHLNQAVKIYPFKNVEAGAIVNTSVVWESKVPRSLFGRRGVRGLANVDMTPQFAVRLAMAYGSTLKKGATVTCSRDGSRAARALKRAFMAGLNATGVNAEELEMASVPLTRFQARTNGGGVTIRRADDDPRMIEIRFFTSDGIDLDHAAQRKIERNFTREDFRRAHPDEMGEISYPPRAQEFYTNALLRAVDMELVGRRSWKVVLDCDRGTGSVALSSVLSRLPADTLVLNPYTTSAPVTVPQDPARLGNLVRASGSDFGIRFDQGGERAEIIDDLGNALDWNTTVLLYVRLMAEANPGGAIILPVCTTRHAARLATAAGCRVIWSQTSPASLLSTTLRTQDAVLAMGEHGVVLPGFLHGFDGLAQFVVLLSLLGQRFDRLSDIVAQLPEVHVVKEEVPTPWECKGAVMRILMEEADMRHVELIDGIKAFFGNDWGLVLPDPEEPISHVWAEADTDLGARNLAANYRHRIMDIVGGIAR